MFNPKLGFFVLAHPLEEGREKASELLFEATERLKECSLKAITPDAVVRDDKTASHVAEKFKGKEVDAICVLEATWSADHHVVDILEEVNVPCITWGIPGRSNGSLCGVQQLGCVLTELGKSYQFIYGDVDEDKPYEVIQKYTRAAALQRKLRRTLLALVGYRVKGMSEVSFDEFELKSLLGPRLIHYGIDELRRITDDIDETEATRLWDDVKKRVGEVRAKEVSGIYSSRVYLALKELVQKDNLSGLAVECYPHLMGEVCLAYSLLAEEGVPCSCEGDVNSLVAMLMLQLLTGSPVHNTDLLFLNEEENSIVFSHCGSSGFSLAETPEKISLSPVRLAHKGVCVRFPAKPGEVTLVNLVGRKNTYRMCVVEGEAVPTEMVFEGNPTRVKFPISVKDFLQIVADNGFGHHWMIGYGHVKEELEMLCKLVGLKCVSLPGKHDAGDR